MNAYVEIIYFYVELVRFVNQILLKFIHTLYLASSRSTAAFRSEAISRLRDGGKMENGRKARCVSS